MLELCVLAHLPGAGAYAVGGFSTSYERIASSAKHQFPDSRRATCQLLANEWAFNPALNTG